MKRNTTIFSRRCLKRSRADSRRYMAIAGASMAEALFCGREPSRLANNDRPEFDVRD